MPASVRPGTLGSRDFHNLYTGMVSGGSGQAGIGSHQRNGQGLGEGDVEGISRGHISPEEECSPGYGEVRKTLEGEVRIVYECFFRSAVIQDAGQQQTSNTGVHFGIAEERHDRPGSLVTEE
jgi:hypothetical protein